MKFSILKKIFCILILFILFIPSIAFAGEGFEKFSGLDNTAENNYDLDKNDIPATIGNIISYILSLLGVVLLIIIVVAYVVMSSAGGDEEKVNNAKKWIKNAVIALVIIMSAYLFTAVFIKFWSAGVIDS